MMCENEGLRCVPDKSFCFTAGCKLIKTYFINKALFVKGYDILLEIHVVMHVGCFRHYTDDMVIITDMSCFMLFHNIWIYN